MLDHQLNYYKSTIGEISFDPEPIQEHIIKSAKPFSPSGIGECKVEIYGPSEGDIPHMHIFNSDKSFDCCVCIHSANYFSHGGKYRDKMNAKQSKQFNDWLKEKNKNPQSFGMTNWEAISFGWELYNENCRFPALRKVQVQPDYSEMVNFKDR